MHTGWQVLLLSSAFERSFIWGYEDRYQGPWFLGFSLKLVQLVSIIIRTDKTATMLRFINILV